MKISELQYELPPELIAQRPSPNREDSRLLIVDRANGGIRHARFAELPEYLPASAILVLNDTRVVPARFEARRRTGGRVAGLFLREVEEGLWDVLLEGRGRLKPGESLTLGEARFTMTLVDRIDRGAWRVNVGPPLAATAVLAEVGRTPLPPYILRRRMGPDTDPLDRERYQTVYAERPGAVAAPTAGLHFTSAMLDRLAEQGVEHARVTLHVGLGTFSPITVDDLSEHRMHAEWFELRPDAADRINAARASGRPIVAVGTTSARVLETCADPGGRVEPCTGWTDIFIYPPYRFRAVDAMITNFHLPGSTLLAMIYAFAGRDLVRRAYDEAIAQGYRFFSYGDAMLVL